MKTRYLLILWAIVLPAFALGITHQVNLDGSGNYISIQAALDAANPGDTVLVYPGRYYESLSIVTNGINLLSLEATTGNPAYIDSTIIDGNNIERCILVSRNLQHINIRGFTITNGFATGGAGGIGLAVNTSSTLTNLRIKNNTANLGGGINVGAATVMLSGVEIFDNYALTFGGGLYASSGGGYVNTITFDPVNRCSIYNNRSGAGQDIFIQDATSDLEAYLDTFSVAVPTTYYAVLQGVNLAEYQVHLDILNAHHQEINNDLYVSPQGDDINDGLSPATALKTIHTAIYRVAGDSLNPKTVHLLPGTYSRTDNEQVFPIALKSSVKVKGSGIDSTLVIGEPHQQIPLAFGFFDVVFKHHNEELIDLSEMSITTQDTDNSCATNGSRNRKGSVNLTNLHIYGIRPQTAAAIDCFFAGDSVWDNLLVENIETMRAGLVNIGGSMCGTISNSIFRNATSTYESASVPGPSLISIRIDKKINFENCEFSNLTVYDDDTNVIQIGAVQFPQQQNHFSFNNCLFTNINSHNDMILVVSSNNPKIDFTNCTFAGNQGDAYTLKVNGEVNIVNCIFDNDTPYQIKVNPMDGNPSEHTNISIDHSLIKDGIDGILPFPVPGNTIDFLPTSISGDPLFVGGFDIHDPLNYSLSKYSPCINAGTPDTTGLALPPYDLAGNWRVWDNRIDMGCYEYGSEPHVGIDDPALPSPPQKISISAYPNPLLNASKAAGVFIEFTLPGKPAAQPVLDIFNVRGQKVKTMRLTESYNSLIHKAGLAGDVKQKGEFYSTVWNGKDNNNRPLASGTYIVKVKADKMVATTKITIIK
ncbi:MAG: choice-of-anchor Q domain-containing protein [Candidatus Cloacimonetes bacterium]|jgi:hypothetical protein|nr:choice-of-anchor Q domain-containing protein [Candidatus Cloacimonadota bacterium]MDD4277460.1 choice-of-anchor Q domain-containing protein [Candidatus Cloacimonadota bacterium]MDY0326357.1 choice-of-anchor Q domain-containing protein [Candidatus Cloacimonadaceae bacterium]